jgi:hypothetical protein
LKKEDTRRWKASCVHWMAEWTLWKWLYYQSHLYIQCNPNQNGKFFLRLHRGRKIIPKVRMDAQKTSNTQTNAEQKRATPQVFKLYYIGAGYHWLIPIILAPWKAEIRRIMFRCQCRYTVHETWPQKNLT